MTVISTEAVEAGARSIRGYAPGSPINYESYNWRVALQTSRELLAAALPLLTADDVPHIVRAVRDQIAGEIEAMASIYDDPSRRDAVNAFRTVAARIARGGA